MVVCVCVCVCVSLCVLVYSDQLATKETNSTYVYICMQIWSHFHYDDNYLHFTQIQVVLAHQSLVVVQLAAHSLVVVPLRNHRQL